MNTIEIGTYKFSFPAKLQEMSVSQALTFFEIYAQPTIDSMTKKALLIQAFCSQKALDLIGKLSEDEIFSLMQLWDWIDEELPCKVVIPSFEHKGVMYYAPKENIKTSCIAEYIYASNCLRAIAEGKENYIKNLVACLYRPKDKKHKMNKSTVADLREKFDTDVLQERLPALQDLDFRKQVAILFYFVSVQKYFQDKFIEVFEETGEGKSDGLGWQGVLMTVAENGIFGDLEATKYANVIEVFTYLTKKKREVENAKVK